MNILKQSNELLQFLVKHILTYCKKTLGLHWLLKTKTPGLIIYDYIYYLYKHKDYWFYNKNYKL